jgi:hypothetical protein
VLLVQWPPAPAPLPADVLAELERILAEADGDAERLAG